VFASFPLPPETSVERVKCAKVYNANSVLQGSSETNPARDVASRKLTQTIVTTGETSDVFGEAGVVA